MDDSNLYLALGDNQERRKTNGIDQQTRNYRKIWKKTWGYWFSRSTDCTFECSDYAFDRASENPQKRSPFQTRSADAGRSKKRSFGIFEKDGYRKIP